MQIEFNATAIDIIDQGDTVRLVAGIDMATAFELMRQLMDGIERTKNMRPKAPNLEFDPDGRTIRWSGDEIKFGRKFSKYWRFIKTLWDGGEKHRAKFDRLEIKVWKSQSVRTNTIFSLVSTLNVLLEKGGFPYKISPVENFSTHEIQGFQLSVRNC